MKLKLIRPTARPGKGGGGGGDGSPAIGPSATFSVQSVDASAGASVCNDGNGHGAPVASVLPPATASTPTSSSEASQPQPVTATAGGVSNGNTKKRTFRWFRHADKEDGVAEARERVARLLAPPPLRRSQFARLGELKAAKARAEGRVQEREGRGGGCGGDDAGTVVSCDSCDSCNAANAPSLDDELSGRVRRDAAVFLSAFLVHLALLPLRGYPLLPLVLIALQSISLRGLLNSLLVYAFDRVDFGQADMLKNMANAKQLFTQEVHKYSKFISVAIAVASITCASVMEAVSSSAFWTCHLLGRWRKKTGICSLGDAPDVTTWGMRAFRISSFVTLRLGVFVASLLLLGHMSLPKPQKRTREENETESEGNDDVRRSARGTTKHGASAISISSFLLAFLTSSFKIGFVSASTPPSSLSPSVQSILVAGSLNADTFLPIHRFPSPGENLSLLPNQHPLVDVPGGKGCNQAIACARLSTLGRDGSSSNRGKRVGSVAFLGQFGNDSAANILQNALLNNNVDISSCGHSSRYPSGRGYVLIVPASGEVSAVVSGGSNLYGWRTWGVNDDGDDDDDEVLKDERIRGMVSPHSLLLLQCEVPHLVNLRLARAARKLGIPVIVDVGGEDRRMEQELLECCDYLVPNETELDRLARSYGEDGSDDPMLDQSQMDEIQAQVGPSLSLRKILKSTATLQRNGASSVLVTLGSHGSLLVKKPSFAPRPSVLYQPPCRLPSGSTVVDETGAGDCYRAGFAVALLEHCNGSIGEGGDGVDDKVLQRCMKFASAAGALAVTRQGAVPSIPSREEVEEMLAFEAEAKAKKNSISATLETVPRGGSVDNDDDFPFMFGSRINSMKDRLDLVDPSLPMSTPSDWLKRQAKIRGLGCVDFNYPQHFGEHWTPEEARAALDEVNLLAGAVCLRYPSKFARGAMNHPDKDTRREAIEITKQAAEVARTLGCNE